MTHRKNKGGGLALFTTLVLALFASGCSGRGGGAATRAGDGSGGGGDNMDTMDPPFETVCTAAVCGSEVLSYDNGAALVLSPNRMRAGFTPGPVLTGAQTGAGPVADALSVSEVRDGRPGATGTADSNMLTLAGVGYSLAEPVAGHIQERAYLYCSNLDQSDCDSLSDENYALGYNTYFRFPDNVLAEDKDIVLGGFTVIKTTLNNDYLAFGVGVSLDHQGDSPNGGHRYRPVEFGSFVFGPRFTATMPTTGLAAYAGFAQAYAQSSNRNYLPFHADGSDVSGIIVNGFSAMVFSFSSAGVKFEHGYIELSSGAFVDTGTDITQQQALGVPWIQFRGHTDLNGSFADLKYRKQYSTAHASVDVSTITNANDFDPNPNWEYDIESRSSNAGDTTALGFLLNANPDTADDMMDFTVLLVRNALDTLFCTQATEVFCRASDRADAGRAGKVQLYGATVDLTSDSNNADNVPTFAGGVWQYEGLVFVDHGADATAGNADDRLLGVVDLYGSLGGLVVDVPAE